MRNVNRSIRAPAQPARRAPRRGGNLAAGAKGGAIAVVLGLLFWLIFYQNLPGNFGLNGTPNEPPDSPGHVLNRFLKLFMLAMSLYVIASRWSAVRSFAKHVNPGIAALMALVALSATWSIEPDATINGTLTLASTVLSCFAICLVGWHPRRFQQLALPALMYVLVVSLVVGMIYPDKITEIGDDLSLKDAWHGITLTKNQFAMVASLGVVLCVHRFLARQGRAVWSIAGAVVAAVCLILSRGNASQFATLLAVVFMVIVLRAPVIKQYFVGHVSVSIAGLMLLYELVIQNVLPGSYTLLAPVRTLTGKDTTFSSRTMIWDLIKEHIQAAPYLGSGYGAYWVGPIEKSPSYIFVQVMWFYPTEAHNGYLDIINDLGYVGLGALILLLLWYVRQALQLLQFDRNQAVLYFAVLFQEMVVNMSESDWLARTNTFAVFCLAIFCLSRHMQEVRLRAATAGYGSRSVAASRFRPSRRGNPADA
jgi:O-antigen ligase